MTEVTETVEVTTGEPDEHLAEAAAAHSQVAEVRATEANEGAAASVGAAEVSTEAAAASAEAAQIAQEAATEAHSVEDRLAAILASLDSLPDRLAAASRPPAAAPPEAPKEKEPKPKPPKADTSPKVQHPYFRPMWGKRNG